MNIILDAMGGDNAPGEIVRGAAEASKTGKYNLILTGDKEIIEKHLASNGADLSKIEIVHTDSVISMEDDPLSVVGTKKDSSMSVGLKMLKESGDAFVSAGNTGALHAGASLIVRNIKGIQRSAIATVIPFARPMLLMDSGANINVTPDYLAQWAVIGTLYMKNVMNVEAPSVGLLNNGTEECKGTQLQIDTYAKLSKTDGIKFAGNVEAKELPFGPCDVIVTDGFTGNITLKLIEGLSKFFFSSLKDMFTHSMMTKVAFLALKDQLYKMKKSFDASEYGGTPILGLSKPVIKAHGSSDARAVLNAIKQAGMFIQTGFIDQIKTNISVIEHAKKGNNDKKEVTANEGE